MPLKDKYLKYTPEITLEIFTLVYNKLIDYGLNPVHKLDRAWGQFSGDFKYLWCLDDNEPNQFRSVNRGAETTVQEILGYDPFLVKDDFVLPEKWIVKVTTKSKDSLEKFKLAKGKESVGSYEFVCQYGLGWYKDAADIKYYTEITFDQFKKYVLKEGSITSQMPSLEQCQAAKFESKEVIPEYVECIKPAIWERTIKENDDNLIFNTKEFKFKHYQGDWKSAYNIAQFKPSTKEAFEAQNKPKSIEEWSVGSYVVAIKDGTARSKPEDSFKIGFIDEIDSAFNDSTIGIKFSSNCCDKSDFKWFATKSEAEEFAKTLVEPAKEVKTPQLDLNEWLDKYKKLNLAVNDLANAIELSNFDKVFSKLKGTNSKEKANILYDLWNFKQPLKQAVHCKTQEEWDFVTEKLNYTWASSAFEYNNENSCIYLDGNQQSSLNYAKTTDYQILSFQEWCDLNGYKMKKELKFEVGKWYKNSNWSNPTKDFIKCSEEKLRYGNICGSEKIYDGKYSRSSCVWLNGSASVLASIEEIQQYLPDGHPDKITKTKDKMDWDKLDIKDLHDKSLIKRFFEEKIQTPFNEFPNEKMCSFKAFAGKSCIGLNCGDCYLQSYNRAKLKVLLNKLEIQLNSEFKVGDWVYCEELERFDYRKDFKDKKHLYIPVFQIEEVHYGWLRPKVGISNGVEAKNCRHATLEEINNHLISIGEIPAGGQAPEKYPFKPLQEGDLEWEIETPTFITNLQMGVTVKDPFYGVVGMPTTGNSYDKDFLTSIVPGPLKMTLSIDDEELPMVNIIKTNVIKQLLNLE